MSAGVAAPYAVQAMATRFELVIEDEGISDRAKRAVAEEALAEIVRIESRLTIYEPASDVSWINAHAGARAVKVEPRLFALLRRCVEISGATDGAFDITMGPLMRAWKFVGDTGALPSPRLVAGARTRAGYQHLELDARASTIRFRRDGMGLDLGAVGKGYAIAEAIAILRGHGVSRALLHGGTSSVAAIGHPAGADGWRIAWTPQSDGARVFELSDGEALSVSAVHGKSFVHEGQRYGHVIDPSTDRPANVAASAAVKGPGSLECDALSTALLVRGREWLPVLRSRFPGYDGSVS